MGILAEFYETVAAPLEDTDPRKAEILQVVENIPSELEVTASAGFEGKIGKEYDIFSPGYIVDAMISRAAILRYIQKAPMRPAEVLDAVCGDYGGIRRSVHVSSLYDDREGRQVFYSAHDGLIHSSEIDIAPVASTEESRGRRVKFGRQQHRHPIVYKMRIRSERKS